MCGIAGVAGTKLSREVVEAMADAVGHRGPDESRIWTDGIQIALGFRRLSIIDLETGSQPMANESGTVIGTCNGEIYNFKTLRARLQGKGHRFSSRSDAEVIVHAYEEYGLDFLHELEGMFAIALWDAREDRLVLARDRMGVKPLYFAVVGDAVVYGSEPSAVLASGLVPRAIDPEALVDYFTLQYVRPPLTGFRGISKLAPGELATYTDGRFERRRWWTLDHKPDPGITVHDALDQLDQLLRDAVARRLVADVPLGAFLSGGVDSSLIVSYMAELAGEVRTFAADFPVERFSEGAHARKVAAAFDLEHTEFLVEPDTVLIAQEIVGYLGEPFADSSAIPTYALAGLTRAHVTVALSGDGGDEAFGGYSRYVLATHARRFPRALRAGARAGAVAARFMPMERRGRYQRAFRALARPESERYAEMMCHFDPQGIEALCAPDFIEAAGDARRAWRSLKATPPPNDVGRFMKLDIDTYLPGDVLTKVDRMSMAHALEVRSPLLSYEVQEFAAALPASFKIRGTTTKWLLKELALRRGVPPNVVHRPKKGFGLPIGEWFRTSLRPWLEDTLLASKLSDRGIVCRPEVQRLVQQHTSGQADFGPQLWNLVMLELWCERWIDEP